jgi:hypothetical protein
MRIPQAITGVGLIVLMILLFAVPQRRRATYDPGTELKISGIVQNVESFYCPISGAQGTHLLVATDKGVIQVHVAPTDYLREKNLSFQKGDRVEIVGSKMRFAGRDAVVARTVSRDDMSLSFRKADGKPVWVE